MRGMLARRFPVELTRKLPPKGRPQENEHEIGNCDVRMKTVHIKTTATMEAVFSHPEENGRGSTKSRRNTSRAEGKATVDFEKRLANP
jgi:hypothetical protein